MLARPGRPLLGAAPLLLLTLLLPGLARASEDPRAWLERMSHAVEQLNYEGTLVHLIGSDATVLKIVHRSRDGRVTEKITADGSGREIIRNDEEVMCILPDQRTVLLESNDVRNPAQSPLRGRLPGITGIRSEYYHLAFVGSERVAGRDTRVVAIRPKDSFRYGYRVSLDRATAMPLKTQLLDEQGKVQEQVLFSDISLREAIPDSALQPSMPIESFAVRRSAAATPRATTHGATDWVATRVPAGFALEVRRARTQSNADLGARHLVYSDGLATVSLFIEPAVAASEQAEGLSQMGSANAYTVVHEGYMVTAVGEVPPVTVELLAISARPVARSAETERPGTAAPSR